MKDGNNPNQVDKKFANSKVKKMKSNWLAAVVDLIARMPMNCNSSDYFGCKQHSIDSQHNQKLWYNLMAKLKSKHFLKLKHNY